MHYYWFFSQILITIVDDYQHFFNKVVIPHRFGFSFVFHDDIALLRRLVFRHLITTFCLYVDDSNGQSIFDHT